MSNSGFCRAMGGLASALVAVIGMTAAPAKPMAADLDNYFANPAPPPTQPVEFGSGWYIRGDAAYASDTLPKADALGLFPTNSSARNSYSFDFGGGYKFTNYFRGDVTVDYRQPLSAYDPTTFTNANGGRWDALINGYIDFGDLIGNWYGIQPYVGAGIGAAWGYTRITSGDPALCVGGGTGQCVGSHIPTSLAWALMAGVAVPIFPHAFIDVGYRYLDLGNYSFWDSSQWQQLSGTGLSAVAHSHVNEIRIGFRYQID